MPAELAFLIVAVAVIAITYKPMSGTGITDGIPSWAFFCFC